MINASDYIPYSSHISPSVIKSSGGKYILCLKLDGLHSVGVEDEELNRRCALLSKAINNFKAPFRRNISTQCHVIRHKHLPTLKGEFKKGFASDLNNNYEAKNIVDKGLMVTDIFVSVVYLAYTNMSKHSISFKTVKDFEVLENTAIQELNEVAKSLLSSLDDYAPTVLETYTENSKTYSQALEFLGLLVNGVYKKIPVLDGAINQYLSSTNLIIGNSPYIVIENTPDRAYCVMLSVTEYPNKSSVGCLEKLFSLSGEMTVTQTFQPEDKTDVKNWLERTVNRYMRSDSASSTELKQLEVAIDEVNNDTFVMGKYSLTIQLRAGDLDTLKKLISKAKSELSEDGFIVSVNKINLLDDYFSQLPSNNELLLREAMLSSDNAAQIMPFYSQSKGKQSKNPWGEALALFPTVINEFYHFNIHDVDMNADREGQLDGGLGAIAGTRGTGKSSMLNFLCSASQRFSKPPRLFIFDMDLNSYPFVKALNGSYTKIRHGEKTGLNPFAGEDTPKKRSFLTKWVKELMFIESLPLLPEDDKDINDAINEVLTGEARFKNLTSFKKCLPVNGEVSLSSRLDKWVGDGYLAWVFDNPEDSLDLAKFNTVGIDYTAFLDDEEVCPSLLMYIFEKVNDLVDGYPLIMTMDEAWKPFKNPRCVDFIEEQVRTIRKKNACVLFASQSPSDFVKNVPSTLIEAINLKVMFANFNAKKSDYMGSEANGTTGLGFTEEEFNIISNLKVKDRTFLVKQGDESVVCKFNLYDVPEMVVLSGSPARAALVDNLINQYGDDSKVWLPKYYELVKEQGI